MTMHKPLQHRNDVDRLRVSKKEDEDNSPALKIALIQRLEDYIQKYRGRLITVTRNSIDNRRINRTIITRKQKWEKNNCFDISSNK